MSEKKQLELNCDICDCRRLKKEAYSQYDKILVNADLLVVSRGGGDVFAGLPVDGNFDSVFEADPEEDVQAQIQTVNGNYTMSKGQQTEGRLLTVNGSLEILPDARETLQSCRKIIVNGNLRCPQSLESCLGSVTVNGGCTIYPDDCIVQKPFFSVDRYFPVWAKEHRRYFAESRVCLTDPQTDVSELVRKQVQFVTPSALIAEELMPQAAALFEERTVFTVVPAGHAVLAGAVVWRESLVRKYRRRLYIDGSLTVGPEGAGGLEKLEHLAVSKELRYHAKFEPVVSALQADCARMVPIKGRTVENKVKFTIDQTVLDVCEDGLLVRQCARVTLAEEVAPARIVDQLEFENCAKIICTREQAGAVDLVSRNVAKVTTEEEEKERKERSARPQEDCVINAEYYVM